jgi:acyl-CoA synthetase (NDP forming)
MADTAAGVELIVGCRRDPRFGPLLLVGLGGIHAEVLGDTAVALAPVAANQAEELIRSLRGAPLLLGARGRPSLDVAAAARVAAALSRLAAEHAELAELEVNPLLVLPEGALGLDARVVYDTPAS